MADAKDTLNPAVPDGNDDPGRVSSETSFFTGLIELQYGKDVEQKLKKIAENIPWAKGWPDNIISFWNAESFMWRHKISKEARNLIAGELSFLKGGKNLDVGCGAYSYLSSVGFDISEKMLLLNDNCLKKIQGDLENGLPFSSGSFDSVTAIFVLNYVSGYHKLLQEIKRILNPNGNFIMVLSANRINSWQRQKEVASFNSKEWIAILQKAKFSVDFHEEQNLCFFRCQ